MMVFVINYAFMFIVCKETMTSTDQMEESDVPPHILRAMKSSKILDILSSLASSIQVLIDDYAADLCMPKWWL